jgi:hypothetical protein
MNFHDIRLASGPEDRKSRTPLESFLLAYAAMVPLVAAAVAVWVFPAVADIVIRLAIAWAGALLTFFAGVHRGLSFRQADGPRLSQLSSMLWLFSLGVTSLISPWPGPALVLQLAGFISLAVLDPIAARYGEAPRYFARLRPVQLLLPVASLLALLVRVLV